MAFGGSSEFATGAGGGRLGLYSRIERSADPVKMYVEGEEE